jgi:hypothetical protein
MLLQPRLQCQLGTRNGRHDGPQGIVQIKGYGFDF